MNSFIPLVTVIVPTTEDRAHYRQRIEKMVMAQDYSQKQLLFNTEEGCVGDKRNRLCTEAIGDIILHMDDDDLYAPDWISKSVERLMNSDADVVGLSELLFYDTRDGAWYIYTYPQNMNNWVAGATMCFWKEFWRKSPFPYLNIGEDNGFQKGTQLTPKIFAHEYGNGFVATIHDNNTSKKVLANPRYRRCTEAEEAELFDTWKHWITNPNP